MSTLMSFRSDELNHKCRCCLNQSINFIQLECSTKTSEGIEKTYKELLNEITNFNIPVYQEYFMPQQLCTKCGQQLKTSYKFIQQAHQVSQHYLQIANDKQQISPDDVKTIEPLQESLVELTETLYDTKCQEEIKVEPLAIEESNTDIKQEIEDNEIIIAINPLKKELLEKNRDILRNSNDANNSSHDEEHDEESDEPESLEGNDDFLSNEPLARRCDICHKIYRNEKFLKIHKRYAHMPEEDKIPCPLCNYKANRSWALRIHMGLVHGQDKVEEYFKPVPETQKEHPCSLCSRSYAHKDSLRNHMKAKHLNKSLTSKEESSSKKNKEKKFFLCNYCGQSFNTKRGLDSHNLTHSDNRPFCCEICNKTFKRLKGLQLHLLIHSDEKPHQCSECSKAFKRVDKLKIHMKVHSELRPYKCRECEKTFKYQSVLRTHMHIHTGQMPFDCKTCGKSFSLKTSLNIHCFKNGHFQ